MSTPKQPDEHIHELEQEESLETKPRHGHSHGFESAPDSATINIGVSKTVTTQNRDKICNSKTLTKSFFWCRVEFLCQKSKMLNRCKIVTSMVK